MCWLLYRCRRLPCSTFYAIHIVVTLFHFVNYKMQPDINVSDHSKFTVYKSNTSKFVHLTSAATSLFFSSNTPL
jgi:hypothetical protein